MPLSVNNIMPRIITPPKGFPLTSPEAPSFTGTGTGAKKESEGEQQQQQQNAKNWTIMS